MRFLREMRTLKRDRRGVTMLEYGLIAALVAVVAITALTSLGRNLGNTFNSVASQLPSSAPQGEGEGTTQPAAD